MRTLTFLLIVMAAGCGTKASTDGTSADTTGSSTDDVSANDTAAGDTAATDTAVTDTSTTDTAAVDAAGDTSATADATKACFGGPDGKCAACLKTNCNTEISACMGTAWDTAEDPKAPCGGMYAGICKCEAAAAAADANGGGSCGPDKIIPTLGAACGTCFNSLGGCLSSHCATDCN